MDWTLAVDLNCDLGEGFGRYDLGDDAEMMRWITSANVACGFHAGDPDVMARTVALAKAHGVALGAHPGYPDLQGFGRRAMTLSPTAIARAVTYQLGALEAFARVEGIPLAHVKPHGALYNLAAQDEVTANAVARAVAAFDRNLILVGLGGSALVRAGITAGLRVANEGFPDRAYLPNGQLMPRDQTGALITDPEQVASNALRLVMAGFGGGDQVFRMDTLCLHGDHHSAVANARLVRKTLEDGGIEIRPLARILGA
jgi:UPF0271 protein